MLLPFTCFLARPQSEPLTRAQTREHVVALTFDACQTARPAGYDSALVKVLRKERVKATLFLGGAWTLSHSSTARALARDPLFEIAQHSNLHPNFKKIGYAQARDDLRLAQATIRRVTGVAPKFFRPPYGAWDKATIRAAQSLGLKTILWSLVTGDPDKRVSARKMTDEVLRRSRPGEVVIMHMNGRGWHTAEALPGIVHGLRAKGYRLVTVSELFSR